MIPVVELKSGMMLKVEGQMMKVLSYELHGAGKTGRVMHAKLRSLASGSVLERRFRADEKVENLDLETSRMEFLYSEGADYFFMNLNTFDQIAIPESVIGAGTKFLRPNMEIFVEYCEGKPVSVQFPKSVDIKIETTAPGISGQSDTTFKEAVLENGVAIMVPQFIKQGDLVKVEVETGRYLDRVVTKQ